MVTSIAHDDFIVSLKIAEELIELERVYKTPPPKRDQAKVSGLRGGAAVLMVASFEAFLKSAIIEHLTRLTVHPPPVAFAALPESMRINSIYNCLSAAMKGPPHTKTEKRDRLNGIRSACARVVAEIIDPTALSSTQSNPSSETVRQLYADLGLPNVFGAIHGGFHRLWKKPEAATFIQDKLNEIVNRRHKIAHTGSALDVTRSQLIEGVRFLKILATVLDRHLRTHIDSLHPS